jgi:hypothetical protein
MLYAFVLLIGLVAVAVYLLFMLSQVPGAAEERLGVLEPLPEDLGRWKPDQESEAAKQARNDGLKRETRVLYQEGGLLGGGKLVVQARYRKSDTNEIVRIDPETVLKRRRIKKS